MSEQTAVIETVGNGNGGEGRKPAVKSGRPVLRWRYFNGGQQVSSAKASDGTQDTTVRIGDVEVTFAVQRSGDAWQSAVIFPTAKLAAVFAKDAKLAVSVDDAKVVVIRDGIAHNPAYFDVVKFHHWDKLPAAEDTTDNAAA